VLPVPGPATTLTVADVLDRMRRHWPLALGPVLFGLAGSIGYVLLAPSSYLATASVVVQPVIADQFGGVNISSVVNMSTEAQVARSSAVAALAGARLGLAGDVVRDSSSVDSPQGTQVLDIHFTARTAAAAAAGAQTVAESYLAYRERSAEDDADRRLESVTAQIRALEARIDAGRAAPAYQDTLRALLADQRMLTSIKATSGGRVITRAEPPTHRATPRPVVDVGLGLAAGLVVGLVLSVTWPRPGRVPPAPVDLLAASRRWSH
jgi:uncharacterized protein involved in exopolysaccharide biosynthesis